MMNEEQFISMVARKLAGQATAEELLELEDLLRSDERMRAQFQLLQQYFTASSAHRAANTEQALERTLRKIRGDREGTPAPRVLRWRWMAAAAVLTGAIVAGVNFWPKGNMKRQMVAVTTDTSQWLSRQNGKATRAVIELADGSKVWLNADSKLQYPPVFGKNSREVYLTGEAFFNVVAGADRPFVVHLSQGMVKVLGTSFNVRAYENEPVQTSVTTGKVAFIPRTADKQDTILITADEKVTYRATSGDLTKVVTSAEDEKAWTEGRLVFKDIALEDICLELERTFGKKVQFASDEPRSFRLTGAFKDNNLQDILYYLSRSKPFRYVITDSLVMISK
ncbi:FecR domain-containing protein [Chitinophaga sedimenti]|uniref:FecR family protein n=1 Tax=Chitinophaga sedimenti TaxID=2033606 RepID=UPI00200472F7|nr:FecR domain-containing protein [Chitinophaga sedimenti]MCK7557104.1 FecR domain-containing protein [Chitinophaga sedimenti]